MVRGHVSLAFAAVSLPASPDIQRTLYLRWDDLLGSMQQYLRLAVAIYAAVLPSCEILALLRKALEDSCFGSDASRAEADATAGTPTAQVAATQGRRAVGKKLLLEVLLALNSPQGALQLLGCSRGPAEAAWRDARMLSTDSGASSAGKRRLDFSLVEVLLARLQCYAVESDDIDDSDAPIAAAAMSVLHKLQSAVCIAANPMALKAYVSIYLKSAIAVVESALKKRGEGDTAGASVEVRRCLRCLLVMRLTCHSMLACHPVLACHSMLACHLFVAVCGSLSITKCLARAKRWIPQSG